MPRAKKSDPAETNVSRASRGKTVQNSACKTGQAKQCVQNRTGKTVRAKQDSQFHTVDKGDILSEWKILYRARILRSGVAVDPGEQESC